ncbi:hypothetical protein LEMLEM_LOCUS16507, partial [Lemmus lemmus]
EAPPPRAGAGEEEAAAARSRPRGPVAPLGPRSCGSLPARPQFGGRRRGGPRLWGSRDTALFGVAALARHVLLETGRALGIPPSEGAGLSHVWLMEGASQLHSPLLFDG